MSLLSVEDLTVAYRSPRAETVGADPPAVDGVSFHVDAGETLGLVGESGCGKSTIALAIARSLPPTARVAGRINLGGTDVAALSGPTLRQWWRNDFAMVYQEPQAALNPTMRVGAQIAEVLRVKGLERRAADREAISLLERVAMAGPAAIARRYPHQISGGQQQRVVIAMALAIRPQLLVLDEPTTGLDATVEREILQLIADLRAELSAAVLFITHDLGLVERLCERVAVLQAGRIKEQGPVANVLVAPTHEYTRELLRCAIPPGRTKHNDAVLRAALPEIERAEDASGPLPLLEVTNVVKHYGGVVASDSVSITIGNGEVVGLVGESGSGKTTLGRIITGLTVPDDGEIRLRGEVIATDLAKRRPAVRRSIQMVFQSPDSTLNPRHRVRDVLKRALLKLGGSRTVEQLAASCRLDSRQLGQLTSTLSGGQKQRVAIARAIAGDAALVVCDEPVSALDVSVQATILRLLVELQEHRDVALLFVSHDLAVVRYLSDRIAVMYAGRIVEEGPTEAVLAGPHHPYTAELLAASDHRAMDTGSRPVFSAGTGPARSAGERIGCVFADRCPRRIEGLCATTAPPLRHLATGLRIECHLDLGPDIDDEVAGEAALI